jgi:hypothetical protein
MGSFSGVQELPNWGATEFQVKSLSFEAVTGHYSTTPLLQYSTTPLLQYSTTPLLPSPELFGNL